jgi:hypothetical protein
MEDTLSREKALATDKPVNQHWREYHVANTPAAAYFLSVDLQRTILLVADQMLLPSRKASWLGREVHGHGRGGWTVEKGKASGLGREEQSSRAGERGNVSCVNLPWQPRQSAVVVLGQLPVEHVQDALQA